jgi:acetyl esterase/lipase
MTTNNNKTSISMKNLFIFIFLCLSFLTNAAIKGERTLTDQVKKNDQVIHIQEVYKTVDTFKLKIDIFYTNQSFERENNTAIVFFHGGGWAFGTPSEFFTTCERYERMRHYLGEGNPKYSRYFDDEILKVADDFLRKYNLLD